MIGTSVAARMPPSTKSYTTFGVVLAKLYESATMQSTERVGEGDRPQQPGDPTGARTDADDEARAQEATAGLGRPRVRGSGHAVPDIGVPSSGAGGFGESRGGTERGRVGLVERLAQRLHLTHQVVDVARQRAQVLGALRANGQLDGTSDGFVEPGIEQSQVDRASR